MVLVVYRLVIQNLLVKACPKNDVVWVAIITLHTYVLTLLLTTCLWSHRTFWLNLLLVVWKMHNFFVLGITPISIKYCRNFFISQIICCLNELFIEIWSTKQLWKQCSKDLFRYNFSNHHFSYRRHVFLW